MAVSPPPGTLRRLDELPSPRGSLPLLGHALQLDTSRLHQQLERWHDELGSPYLLRVGPRKVFVSADADLLQLVLRERPDRYRRLRQIETCTDEMGGKGLFSVEGESWRRQRGVVMSALNATNFRRFFPTMQAITARLHRRWRTAAERGDVIEMSGDLVRFTVDVTTALAFGDDPNTLEQDGDLIQEHLARVFPRLMARINMPVPYWRYFRLPEDRRFDASLRVIHSHIDELIGRARQRLRDVGVDEPRNLLEAMLVATEAPDSGLGDEDIRANVLTLLLAGEDTTAHTLAWTMYFLAQNDGLQQQLHEQARAVLGDAPVCPAYEQLRELDAFEAAATEAARLKPVAPMFFLEPIVDVELGGVALPAGTPMFFLLRPAMVDDVRFADAGAFRPERWAAGHAVQPHETRAYLQFGAGPRVCPGRHLAGVEIRLVLSMLMREFSVSLAVDPASVREVMAFAMGPNGMPVMLRPRARDGVPTVGAMAGGNAADGGASA